MVKTFEQEITERIKALEFAKKQEKIDIIELRKKVFGPLSTPVIKKQDVNNLWEEYKNLPIGEELLGFGNAVSVKRVSEDEWYMMDDDIMEGYQSLGRYPDLQILAVRFVKFRRYLEEKCGRLWHLKYVHPEKQGFHSSTGLQIVVFDICYCELKYYKQSRYAAIKKEWAKK